MATVRLSEELSIAGVLERAADLIEPEGASTQGRFGNKAFGCCCIMGALHQLQRDMGAKFEDVVQEPSRFLCAHLNGIAPAYWNDAPERTQQEVVAKLREAAALAREQGK